MSPDDSVLGVFGDREFLALSGTAFARAQAYSTILIALALFADAYGTTGFVEGLWGTSFAVVQLLIVLPLGRAIDTHDAKRFLVVGLLLNVFVFLGFVLVQNPVHVILVRLLQGIGASLLWITGSTVVGQIAEDGARGRWLGVYNQIGAFSSFAGDLVGGYLLYAYDMRITFIVLAAITLGATILVLNWLRANPGGQVDTDVRTGRETFRELLQRPMIASLVTFRLTFSIGKMTVIIFLPIYARRTFHVSPLAIGGILAGGKLTKALLQGHMGELTDRLGHGHYFVLVGALINAFGTALIPLAGPAQDLLPSMTLSALGRTVTATGPVIVLFVAYAILGVGDSVRLPASMSLFVEQGEYFDSVASSMSLRSISWKIGQVAGPVLIGSIKDAVSIMVALWTAAGFVLVASFAFMFVRTTYTPNAPPQVDPDVGD